MSRMGKVCATGFLMLSLVVSGLFLIENDVFASGPCPQGSYTRTCSKNAVCDANSVTATCGKIGAGSKRSTLNLPCRGDIANCDGTLRCLCGSNCPQGSYKQSCWCCYIEGSKLYCHCKNKKGKSQPTDLPDYQSCQTGSIWNDNSHLKCKR